MKYKTQSDMDNRIERIISSKVKHYYSDWKNYDRSKYMHCKGSNDRDDKKLILIARKCGTYLLRVRDVEESKHVRAIYDYFMDQESADYYDVDLEKLEVCRHNAVSLRLTKQPAA